MPPRSPIVVIPSRLAATRLPNKPLADLNGRPMIVRVVERALEADLGPVLVAAADPQIVAAVTDAGAMAVLTDPGHPSGSDRIFEAVERVDPDRRHDAVVNIQGDLPTIAPDAVRASLGPLRDTDVGIATLGAVIEREEERTNPNVVKAVVEFLPGARSGRALYFTRATAPWGEGPLLHHIGLYTYRREALARFVSLPPAALERRERLEQLRALANGIRIDLTLVDDVPLGVDTPEDLERARLILSAPSKAI